MTCLQLYRPSLNPTSSCSRTNGSQKFAKLNLHCVTLLRSHKLRLGTTFLVAHTYLIFLRNQCSRILKFPDLYGFVCSSLILNFVQSRNFVLRENKYVYGNHNVIEVCWGAKVQV